MKLQWRNFIRFHFTFLVRIILLTTFIPWPNPVYAATNNESLPARSHAPFAVQTYTVRPHDSLHTIAQRVYGDASYWRSIYAANTEVIGASPRRIHPGQVLQIPDVKQPTRFACNGQLMTEAQLVAYRNITLDTLKLLHDQRGLTHAEICDFSDEKLERAIRRAQRPKPDHPDEAVAFRRLQLKDEKGYIPEDGLVRAAEHVRQMQANPPPGAGINPTSWTWIGPGNIGGRIRSFLIHPTNANLMWLGSVSGGIWRTTNGGTSWQIVNDFLANMAVSAMVMDPTNANTMYAGTGEGFYNADGIQGAGVFKSTDGGATWNQLAATNNSNWYYVNRLAIHPANNQILLAATRTGIWRTTNAGSSWTQIQTTETLDIDFDPTNGNNAIAGGRGGRVWYSTNAGSTWTAATGLPNLGTSFQGRVEVAYAPSNPAIVYASMDNNSGEIYKSADGGHTYTGPVSVGGTAYLGSQGWYDNALWVDPTNSNVVIVGGIDLWRSTNGGVNLTKISQWQNSPTSAHADHHYMLAHPGFNGTSNTTVFFGNDGGIYRAANVYTVAALSGWQELNNNLGITQFYGGAGNASSGVIIGGTQDNGTLRYTTAGGTEGWSAMFGGDGGYNAADPTDPNYFYGEYVYLNIHRSTNGGASSNFIYSGITDAASSNANFIAPFILDPNNANTLLGGGNSLWRSTNVKAATPTWTAIKPGIGSSCPSANNCISAIAVALGNSNIIWVGHNNGNVYKTTNGTAAIPTWTQVDNNTPALPNRYVTRITIDPTNSNRVYVTFGGFTTDNVWRTNDGGSTWSDITGSGATGLPNVPVRSLVVNAGNTNWLYVGTELGIYTSEDQGATWTLPHDGPTNTSVDELFWVGTSLIAATHGRGMFKATPVIGADFTVGATPASIDICAPNNAVYNVTVGSLGGFANPVTLSTSGVPSGASATFSPNPVTPPGNSNLTIGNTSAATPGSYTITINGASGSTNKTTNVQLSLATATPGTVNLTAPANNATGVAVLPTLQWSAATQAKDYQVEIATDAGFVTRVYSATVTGVSHTVATALNGGTTYYWRVRPRNTCGSGAVSSTFSFTTAQIYCRVPNLAIPDGDANGIIDTLTVAPNLSIQDLNVSLKVNHTWVGDLVFTLEHVATSTTSTLVNQPGTGACNGDNMNVILDDEAALSIQSNCTSDGSAYIDGGAYQPNAPLTVFDGKSIGSSWRLKVADLVGSDVGTLQEWCLIPTVANTAPVAPVLSIARSGNNINLSWTDDPANQGYEVHRSLTPFFTPGAGTLLTTLSASTATYTDAGAAGNPGQNHFYIVRATVGGQGANSNEVGEIDYALNNSGGKYSLIALPFPSTTINNAASLASAIGNVSTMLKWNPATQTFRLYTPPTSAGDNFPVSTGDAIFVALTSSAPAVFSQVGNVTAVQYTLQPGGYNFIALPLQRASLTNASAVAANITHVTTMLAWNPTTQAFRIYVPPTNAGDNFAVAPGAPFIVQLDASGPTTWP